MGARVGWLPVLSLLTASLLSSGCDTEATPRCGASAECPSGYECREGSCQQPLSCAPTERLCHDDAGEPARCSTNGLC